MPRQVLSTYRVQLRAEFDFDAAAAIAEYLAAGPCRLADLLARFPVALLSWRA